MSAAATKDDRADGDAGRVLPSGIYGGALSCRRSKPGIWGRSFDARFLGDFWSPAIALPVNALSGWLACHAFPPHATLRSERDVGEDGVLRESRHRVRIGLDRRSRRDSEEPSLRINGAQTSFGIRSDPGNIVADGPDFPAFGSEFVGRNHHCEIGFAARAWKSRRNVRLLAVRIFDPDDEHVLSHPAFVPRHVRGDAEGKTFLAEQCIASITGTVRPDFTALRKVDDVLFVITRPGDISLSRLQGRAETVQARDYALVVFIDFFEHGRANARHDAHAGHHVWRVRKLYPNLRHSRCDRAHAERQHIHRPAIH